MAIYAKLNSNNIVENVIEADQDFINSLPDASSYKLGEYSVLTKKPRANIGNFYIQELDVFVDPQPFPSWSLDSNYEWKPPVSFPVLPGNYEWDEETKNWRIINGD